MAQHKIEPQKVTKPLQLLAAWLVALIVLDAAFLTAASSIGKPDWAPAVLTIAAIVNVPVFLAGMFVLQTKYRPEMQEDSYYSIYLKEQKRLDDLGGELELYLKKAGINLESLASGQSLNNVSQEIQGKIEFLLAEMEQMMNEIAVAQPAKPEVVNPELVLEIAKALMAQGKWMEAAKQFDEYIKHHPLDWEVHLSRGVAYANTRAGLATNIGALRAYNETIALTPNDIDDNLRARLFAYRGAMLKRLRRLDEAEADLLIAQKYATADYETNDIKYNLAGVYALKGDRSRLLDMVRQLRNAPRLLLAIQAHLDDYFLDFADDTEFLQSIGVY